MNQITCGIDWAEGHHDIALLDRDGQLVAKRRIAESVDGFAELITLLAEAGDSAEDPIPVAIETPRGLLVAALRATGRAVYAINPMAVARYRERHSQSRKKSDHADAVALANILRTDAPMHRCLPADTDLVRQIAVLARAHQDATWRRSRASNELRSLLREYFPGFLHAFAARTGKLTSPEARAVLAIAPTPATAAGLSKTQIAAALRRAGKQRGIATLAAQLQAALRRPQLRQPWLVEDAMGAQALALLASLNAECNSVERLGEATIAAFTQHPDHEIIISFVGLGDLTGARVLAEIGDDRSRFNDARAVKAFAGSARSPRRPAAASASPTGGSRTTGWPRLASSGPSSLPAVTAPAGTTTSHDATMATATPRPCDICSTACSDSSSTAYKPARPTTATRHSRREASAPSASRLDAYQDRRSVDEDLLGRFRLVVVVWSLHELACSHNPYPPHFRAPQLGRWLWFRRRPRSARTRAAGAASLGGAARA